MKIKNVLPGITSYCHTADIGLDRVRVVKQHRRVLGCTFLSYLSLPLAFQLPTIKWWTVPPCLQKETGKNNKSYAWANSDSPVQIWIPNCYSNIFEYWIVVEANSDFELVAEAKIHILVCGGENLTSNGGKRLL